VHSSKIDFREIGAPQRKDIVNASIRDIKSKLGVIHESSIVSFTKDAENLLQEYKPEDLVSRLLAFLSGQCEEIKSRSLLVGAEGFVTFQIETDSEFRAASYVWSCLRRVIPQSILDKVKGLRTNKNMKGAVFDIQEADCKEFELALKSFKNPKPGFVISKCETLPEFVCSDQRQPTWDKPAWEKPKWDKPAVGGTNKTRRDVFIGNLPFEFQQETFTDFLAGNGIEKGHYDLRVVLDKDSGKMKGFCFASVYDDTTFNSFMDLRSKKFEGRALKIDDANSK